MIRVDVVVGGDRVEDEIEALGVLLHLVRILRNDDFVCAEADRVVFLLRTSREDNDVSSKCMGKFHAHVSESAETDDADFLALRDAPMAHGRVRCNSRAEQGSSSGKIQIRGNAKDKLLVDDDTVGVTTIGDASEMFVWHVEGQRQVRAELLEASLALGTGAVGIDQTANCGEVSSFELGDSGADLGHAADDLMAGNDGVNGGHEFAPLISHRVKVGMADAAEQDFDLYIVFGWFAPRDGGEG